MGVFGRKRLSGANVVAVVRVGLLSMRSGLNRERHVGGGKWRWNKAGIALGELTTNLILSALYFPPLFPEEANVTSLVYDCPR